MSVHHHATEPAPEPVVAREDAAETVSAFLATVRRRRTVKASLRAGAEKEEQAFYESRASAEWRAALEPLGTD